MAKRSLRLLAKRVRCFRELLAESRLIFWPKAGFFWPKVGFFWPEQGRLWPERAGFRRLRRLQKGNAASNGNTGNTGNTREHGIHGNTGNTGNQGNAQNTLFWPEWPEKPALLALTGQKEPNQVVLDSPDPSRVRIRGFSRIRTSPKARKLASGSSCFYIS